LLTWWYRSRRFLLYVAVTAMAVAAGYLFASDMLGRLAVLAGGVGVVMTVTGALLLRRFLRSGPRV
jgi:membrane associated rhomboid family serine protease